MEPESDEKVFMKTCTVELIPPPPPPDPCKLQRMRIKEAAGVKFCPRPPIIQPDPPPECLGLCIEKVKNPPITLKSSGTICTVDREVTTQDRCDEILSATLAQLDAPWPNCPLPPPIPPPPIRDPCEEQDRRNRIATCKERMKKWIE